MGQSFKNKPVFKNFDKSFWLQVSTLDNVSKIKFDMEFTPEVFLHITKLILTTTTSETILRENFKNSDEPFWDWVYYWDEDATNDSEFQESWRTR